MLEAHQTFARLRGNTDRETRDWAQALVDVYPARDKAEPGRGYDTKFAARRAKRPTKAMPPPR